MSGVAGAFVLPSSRSKKTAYDQLKHMVPKLENRGQAGFGVAAFMHEGGFQYTKSCRPPGKLARIGHDEQDARFRANVAIAHVRTPSFTVKSYADLQPLDNHKAGLRHLAVCLNGALVNADELREELRTEGHPFSSKLDAEVLLRLTDRICQRDYWQHALPVDYEKVFQEIDRLVDGAVSALMLDGLGNLTAFRNRSGLRPLEFMQTEDGFLLFASENSAFYGLKGQIDEIRPSHIKHVNGRTGDCLDRFVGRDRHSPKLCAYETLYLANARTMVRGQSNLTTRRNIGLNLGRVLWPQLPVETSSAPIIVASMPRTGAPYADGLFSSLLKQKAVLVERDEVVAIGCHQRTLIGVLGERKSLISQKYRLNGRNVRNRNIIVADEALIRGDTSRAITKMLLGAGAKAVHWAIGSPPIVAPNYYGMGIETIDELAFWRIWKTLPTEMRQESLRFHRIAPQTLEVIQRKIALSINAATVTYLPFQTFLTLLPQGHDGIDLSAFTFEMPTPAGQKRANENLSRFISDQLEKKSSE
ncbi:hypothetical protein NLM27_25430 [Bradyrhizobium sp. CCGB12]|uniref:hypothetical protein n=1 Tax=Bradyrhizobium sp. CCGB12 TaxID=2949632 RepID=UPI0020B3D964|nr:hypothetical protein [Bradyrhizobium sp. CCGB12]MCP3392130.1 hypothetical protein [Bradyrhizobium sp. CCGB12]